MILVTGDIMLDEYIRGEATRLAPEAPVPVVLMDAGAPELRLGGAANVAASIAALGERVALAGPYGSDRESDLRRLCEGAGVELLRTSNTAMTTVKTRVIDPDGRLLVRLDHEVAEEWDGGGLRTALDSLRPDAVVFSDYGKGCWTPGNWLAIASHLKRRTAPRDTVKLVVDAKRRLEQYEGAGVVKCNRGEWDRFGGDRLCPAGAWAVVTKGKSGLSYGGPRGADPREWADIPAVEHDVHDVTGAGDVVTAVIAVGLARGAPMDKLLESAVRASSVSVTKPMTGVADPADVDFGDA